MPQARVAAELGLSVTRLQRLRRAAGIARRRTAVDGAEAVRLYVEDGLGVEQVAARLGTSGSAVRYRLERAGATWRSPGAGHAPPDGVWVEALARIAVGERPVDAQRALGISETTLLRWRRATTTGGAS